MRHAGDGESDGREHSLHYRRERGAHQGGAGNVRELPQQLFGLGRLQGRHTAKQADEIPPVHQEEEEGGEHDQCARHCPDRCAERRGPGRLRIVHCLSREGLDLLALLRMYERDFLEHPTGNA